MLIGKISPMIWGVKKQVNTFNKMQTNPFASLKCDTFELSFKSANLNDENFKKRLLDASSDIYSDKFVEFINRELKGFSEDTVQNIFLEVYDRALKEENPQEIVLDIFSNLKKYKDKKEYTISLNSPISHNSNTSTLIDFLTEDNLPHYLREKLPEEKKEIQVEFDKLLESKVLTEREKRILRARFSSVDNKLSSLVDIAEKEKVSYTTV